MRFSIWPSAAQPWDAILDIAAHCEASGWDGVYIADHFMPNGPDETPLDGDTLECWTLITALAASVPRVRLASLVSTVLTLPPGVRRSLTINFCREGQAATWARKPVSWRWI